MKNHIDMLIFQTTIFDVLGMGVTMKKSIRNTMLILLAVCMTGCGSSGGEGDATPTKGASAFFEEDKNSGIKREVAELLTLTDGVSHDVLHEVLERKDASEQAKYNAMNQQYSMDPAEIRHSLVCVDADTGAVYFVNQNQDWFIYRLLDGKAELAVALPAKELCIWNGTLYFMIDSYELYDIEGADDGDIFAYTPSEGIVECVYAGEALEHLTITYSSVTGMPSEDRWRELDVNENGIYFTGSVGYTEKILPNGNDVYGVEWMNYYLPFGATEPTETEVDNIATGWREYQIFHMSKEGETGQWLYLQLRDKKSIAGSQDLNIKSGIYSVMGDELYYQQSKKIGVLNLATGEENVYDFQKILEAAYPEEAARSKREGIDLLPDLVRFTLTEDYIWVYDYQNNLFRMDRQSKEALYGKIAEDCSPKDLYTDGKQVYALDSSGVVQLLTEQMDWSDPEEERTIGTRLLVQTFQGEEDITPAPTTGASAFFEEDENGGIEKAAPECLTLTDGVSRDVLHEVLEKKVASEKTSYNMANRKQYGSIPKESYFCADADTGAVYFVNQNQDWFIYRLLDGKAELAVALPAKELCLWDGTLYFMIESYGLYDLEGADDGDIYAYTPSEGIVECVYAGEALEHLTITYVPYYFDAGVPSENSDRKLAVNESGVYFIGSVECTEVILPDGDDAYVVEKKHYHLPFGATEPVEDPKKMTVAGWREYRLGSKGDEWVLESRNPETEDRSLNIPLSYGFIIGDELYCKYRKEIRMLNLATGEETVYDFREILEITYPRHAAASKIEERDMVPDLVHFTLTEDYIWAYDYQNNLFRMDRRSKETLQGKLAEDCSPKELYTDGKQVYALDSSGVVQLLTEQVDWSAPEDERIIETRPLVEE